MCPGFYEVGRFPSVSPHPLDLVFFHPCFTPPLRTFFSEPAFRVLASGLGVVQHLSRFGSVHPLVAPTEDGTECAISAASSLPPWGNSTCLTLADRSPFVGTGGFPLTCPGPISLANSAQCCYPSAGYFGSSVGFFPLGPFPLETR